MAFGMDTILVKKIYISQKYPFGATSLQQNLVYASQNIYHYSKKHRHTYWALETPLSLVGYLSNLRKQLFMLTNKGIRKKIYGDRPMRLTSVIEHSAMGYTVLKKFIHLEGHFVGWPKM